MRVIRQQHVVYDDEPADNDNSNDAPGDNRTAHHRCDYPSITSPRCLPSSHSHAGCILFTTRRHGGYEQWHGNGLWPGRGREEPLA